MWSAIGFVLRIEIELPACVAIGRTRNQNEMTLQRISEVYDAQRDHDREAHSRARAFAAASVGPIDLSPFDLVAADQVGGFASIRCSLHCHVGLLSVANVTERFG